MRLMMEEHGIRLFEEHLTDGSLAYDVRVGKTRIVCADWFSALFLFNRLVSAFSTGRAIDVREV